MPSLQARVGRTDGRRQLPVFLQLPGLQKTHQTQTGRLLRVLFLWNGSLPANSASPRSRKGDLLHLTTRRQAVSPWAMKLSCKPGVAAVVVMLILSGCASVPPDLGRSDVDALVAERGQGASAAVSAEASAELLASLTGEPLTPESAIRIALLNNPQLAATYATLGFGAADVYQAGRIRNPVFSASVLNSSLAFEQDQITFGLAASFTDLITLSARKRLSAGAFSALKQSIGDKVLHVTAETAVSYYRYVSAQQVAALRRQTARAAELSARLAERYFKAGNINSRELAMQQAEASEARLTALEADAAAFAARTSLATLLGLSVGANWTAPSQLLLPPGGEDDLASVLELARKSRLDLASATTQADVLADRLGVVNWTRWLGELDLGVETEREPDGGRLTGPTLSWEIPIFNSKRDDVLRASAEMQIAVAEVRRLAIAVDNDVRLAYAELQNARARVEEYRDELIPRRIEAVAQAQREVSYMLIGVFELISLKRQEYEAYQGYLESVRDYWVRRVALSLAAGNEVPAVVQEKPTVIDVQEFVAPNEPVMDHSMHGSMNHETSKDQVEDNGDTP